VEGEGWNRREGGGGVDGEGRTGWGRVERGFILSVKFLSLCSLSLLQFLVFLSSSVPASSVLSPYVPITHVCTCHMSFLILYSYLSAYLLHVFPNLVFYLSAFLMHVSPLSSHFVPVFLRT
jgi:hypothetical protein